MDKSSRTIEIKDHPTIDTIVKQYNELPYPAGESHGCTMDDGTRLNMAFTFANGKEIIMVENPACSSIVVDQDFGLDDNSQTLFNYVKTLVDASSPIQ